MKNKAVPIICLIILLLYIGSMISKANKEAELDNAPVNTVMGKSSSELDYRYKNDSRPESTSHRNRTLPDYVGGRDGKLYETKACGLCNGTGIESNAYGDARICPMCDGAGHQSY